jgi:hypothetical protein
LVDAALPERWVLCVVPEVGGVAEGRVVVVAVVAEAGAEDPCTLVPGVGSKSIQPKFSN